MIAFEFDRPKMRRRLAAYSVILLGGLGLVTLLGLFSSSHHGSAGRSWTWWLVLVLMALLEVRLLDYVLWVGVLIRGLRRQKAAFVVNEAGIIDNASESAVGQLAWGEIEKMYPSNWNSRLLLNWWKRMPVISRQRGVVVVLKDDVDLQHCLAGKSKLVRSLMRQWYESGRGRWLFIPEMAIAVTADEMMTRLNDFYATQVREPV